MVVGKVDLELSRDEALVLYEWVRRFNKRVDVSFGDQAEQRVLWDIEALLETLLEEPFSDEYEALLAAARGRIRDAEE